MQMLPYSGSVNVPSSGVNVCALYSGGNMLAIQDTHGGITYTQSSMGRRCAKMVYFQTSTPALWNMEGSVDTTGSFSFQTPASANLYGQWYKYTGSAATNSQAHLGTSATAIFPAGGGMFQCCFYTPAIGSASTLVAGFGVLAFGVTVNPSTYLNCAFFGYDDTDTNMQFMCNDGAGTCTKINLGANFPAHNTTSLYFVSITYSPGGANIDYFIENLGTSNIATGNVTSNLPTGTVGQNGVVWANTKSQSASVSIATQGLYLEGYV